MRSSGVENVAQTADHDGWVTTMHPIFTRDLREGESPDVMYSIYRYIDRLFEPKRHRDDEIAEIVLKLMSARARHLMRCTLILKRQYEDALNRFPNLRGLERNVPIREPIWLSEEPKHSWSYFRKNGIYL